MRSKILALTFLTLCLIIASCSSSDDDSSQNASAEGTWQLTSLRIGTSLDLDGDGTMSRDLFTETNCYENDFISFNDDGSVRVVTGLADIYPQLNAAGTAWEYVYDCPNGLDVMSIWEQSDNTVTVVYAGSNLTGTISGDTMTVFIPQFLNWQLYVDQNTTTTITEDVTLTYVKN